MIVHFDILVLVQIKEPMTFPSSPSLKSAFSIFSPRSVVSLAVFGGGCFGKTTVGSSDFDGHMVDIMGSAINGSHAHDSVFVYLEAKERAMQIFSITGKDEGNCRYSGIRHLFQRCISL